MLQNQKDTGGFETKKSPSCTYLIVIQIFFLGNVRYFLCILQKYFVHMQVKKHIYSKCIKFCKW